MPLEESFLATGIGSLPHRDEGEAFRLVLETFPHIPFWPQLPKRSFLEGMIAQYSQGFPSLKWDERERKVWVDTAQGFDQEVERFYQFLEAGELDPFAITGEFSKGFQILNDLSRDRTDPVKYIKGQITGPITFGLALTDQEKKPIFHDPTLREILLNHLSLKARWMEKRFNVLFPGATTIIFFDEPSLSSYGSPFSGLNRADVVVSLNECFSAVKGLKGVHCCGNTDWSLLLATKLDILSFDAYGYFETISLYPKEIEAFLERGGILAWGLTPSSEAIADESALSLVSRFNTLVETISRKGIDPTLLQRAILTPSCGLASLPVPLAERVCRVTAEVSKILRGG
jgi:methionine synthase II (cobalamin-independent)